MENFKPDFKENSETNEQFIFENGKWKVCDEDTINTYWKCWVSAENADRYNDEYGFTIYGYKTEKL